MQIGMECQTLHILQTDLGLNKEQTVAILYKLCWMAWVKAATGFNVTLQKSVVYQNFVLLPPK